MGRDGEAIHGEENGPNTIDYCADGNGSTDRGSVKQIVVESVKGNDLRGGELVKITATVDAHSIKDQIDFYFTSDASTSNPVWIFITKVAPIVGEQVVSVPFGSFPEVRYTLPKCTSSSGCQQVRVSLQLLLPHASWS